MSKVVKPALMLLMALIVLTAVVYALMLTGAARALSPQSVTASAPLIAQAFTGPHYFHGRAAAPAAPARVTLVKAELPSGSSPADPARAASLDPHMSPAAAGSQIKRVATLRHAPQDEVRKLVGDYTEGRLLGAAGEPAVNVLGLNLALDARWPVARNEPDSPVRP